MTTSCKKKLENDRMNTALVQYGHSVRTKQYTKNPNAKYAVKAEISMKTLLRGDNNFDCI